MEDQFKDPQDHIEEHDNQASDSPNGTEKSEPAADETPTNQEVLVGMTIEELDQMKEELETAQTEAKDNLLGWQRAQADFANFKRRTERDKEMMRNDATTSVVKKFIDILDDFEIALRNRPTAGDGAAWAVGIEIIYKKILTSLENQNVKRMETDGQLFDPHFHEAISQEESPDHESGAIIEVLKSGYMIGERVVRPALVRVAA